MNRFPTRGWIALLALLGCLGTARGQVWSGQLADQVISHDDGSYAWEARLLLEGGLLHAVWSENVVAREVHYGRSSDNGLTWSSTAHDRVISHGNDPTAVNLSPVIAGRGGPLLVCWNEDAVSADEILYGVSTDDGLTWSSEAQDRILSYGGSTEDAWTPSAAAAGETFHVVWAQFAGPTVEILYSRSTDGGQNWSGTSGDRVISFPDGNHASQPKIALGTDGRLYVVWIENNAAGLPAIHFGRSTDGGDTWSCSTADREITMAFTELPSLSIAAGLYDPYIHVVYSATELMGPRHREIFDTYSWDGGQNWTGQSMPVRVSCNEGGDRWAHNPDVYISRCGPIAAVWDEIDEVSGSSEIHWSQFIDQGWSGVAGDQTLSFPGGWSAWAASIAGEQDAIPFRDLDYPDVWVVWSQPLTSIGDNTEILLSRTQLCLVGGAETEEVAAGLHLAPNPSWGEVRIELPAGAIGPVEIIDAAGRVVRVLGDALGGSVASRTTSTTSFSWDGRDHAGQPLPAGVYLVRTRDAGGVFSSKIIRY